MDTEKAASLSEEAGINLFSSKPRKRAKTASAAPALPSTAANGTTSAATSREAIAAEALSDPPQSEATGAAVQLVDGPEERLMDFRELGTSEWLDRVCSSLGMKAPTAVQRGCIPAILAVSHGKLNTLQLPSRQHVSCTGVSSELQRRDKAMCKASATTPAARGETGYLSLTGKGCNRHSTHWKWKNRCVCTANPAETGRRAVWHLCTGLDAHQVGPSSPSQVCPASNRTASPPHLPAAQ